MRMKKLLSLALAGALMLGCACAAGTASAAEATTIVLSDGQITVDGAPASADESSAVYVGADIVYYEDRDTQADGSAYGEGTASERHSAEQAAAHTVVTITQPGTYRLTGTLSQGQIAIDLGKKAKDDPDAVVTVILDNASVTCTVAPALIFYNVYECDRDFVSYDNGENPDYKASSTVDTSAAGANVILAAGSVNSFTGSHVARIYKPSSTKKLHKYDGAFYSKMSMNIFGDNGDDSGVLNIVGDSEGLDAELHLTLNGGTIRIQSQDDGINTNEDFVSVTTVNGGNLTVNAGLGAEGDGIDSNGYLVINGGTVWTMSNDRSPDGGIDADSPILINGGTVSAFGTRNDAASNESNQPYMELSFASTLPVGSVIELKEGDTTLWAATTQKACQSVTLTAPELKLDTVYNVYVDGVLQCWSGNSFGMGHMGGGFGGQRLNGMTRPADLPQEPDPAQMGERPDDMPEPPEDFAELSSGATPSKPADDMTPPEGFDPTQKGQRPDGMNRHDGLERPDGTFGGGRDFSFGGQGDSSGSTDFTLTATTKSFSGVCDSDASGKTRLTFDVQGSSRVGRSTVLEQVTAITPSAGIDPTLVQITITDDPSENYAASCLLSDGLDAVNALLPADDGDYTLTVAVLSGTEGFTGATQLSFTVGSLPFVDVAETSDSYAAVKALYQNGVIQGDGAGRFYPDLPIQSAHWQLMLDRLAANGVDVTAAPGADGLTRAQAAQAAAELLGK